NTSMRFTPQATAAGSAVMPPPNDSHRPAQAWSNQVCCSVLSLPRAKTSSRPAPHDDTAGPEASDPPNDAQADHWLLAKYLCQTALSAPRTKRSIRPDPQDTAAGSEVAPCSIDSRATSAASGIARASHRSTRDVPPSSDVDASSTTDARTTLRRGTNNASPSVDELHVADETRRR